MRKPVFLMRVSLLSSIALTFSIFSVSAQNAKIQEVMNSLLRAEKQLSFQWKSPRELRALLESVTPNAILFRPDPKNGPEYLEKTVSRDTLTRAPTYAELSDDGFFGYVMGNVSGSSNGGGPFGNYVSVWLRDPFKKNWKLFVDASIQVPTASSVSNGLSYTLKPIRRYPNIYPKAISASKDILLSSDIIFATLLQTRSVDKAYKEFLSDESKLLIDGKPAIQGRDSIITYLKSKNGTFRSSATGGYVCYTRELGFTYGSGAFIDAKRRKPADFEFYYLRIWRKGKDGLWRVIIELQKKAR